MSCGLTAVDRDHLAIPACNARPSARISFSRKAQGPSASACRKALLYGTVPQRPGTGQIETSDFQKLLGMGYGPCWNSHKILIILSFPQSEEHNFSSAFLLSTKSGPNSCGLQWGGYTPNQIWGLVVIPLAQTYARDLQVRFMRSYWTLS